MPVLELPDRHDVHRTLAEAHLRKVEPRFAPIMDAMGPCTLTCEPNLFRSLVRAIVSQLISTAAARTINERLEVALKRKVAPAKLLALTDVELRASGISGGKAKALRGLAELFQGTRGLNAKLLAADDDAIRSLLLPLHGVGPWTIDMFLIFAMGRPDVWPVGDLGVRAAAKDLFGLKELPDAKAMTAIAEPWRPYRTFAAWYLWRTRGWVPQSGGRAYGRTPTAQHAGGFGKIFSQPNGCAPNSRSASATLSLSKVFRYAGNDSMIRDYARDYMMIPPGTGELAVVNMIVEIPKGRRTKFEIDKQYGLIKMDRYLYSSSMYPGDYGFIPQTLSEDGDPSDILVMVNEPTFPGCLIEARVVGIFRMKDKGFNDFKLLAVPHKDPLFGHMKKLEDVPSHFLREVEHFFSTYKTLEGVTVEPLGWDSQEAGTQEVRSSVDRFRSTLGNVFG